MLIGFLSGIGLASFYFYFPKEEKLAEVKTTQLSGEKIIHSEFDYTLSDRIIFTTESDGKGKIKTEIPKTNIPEAKNWLEKNNSIQFELILSDERLYSSSYWRRWSSFSVGGGVIFATNSFKGIKFGAQLWF